MASAQGRNSLSTVHRSADQRLRGRAKKDVLNYEDNLPNYHTLSTLVGIATRNPPRLLDLRVSETFQGLPKLPG